MPPPSLSPSVERRLRELDAKGPHGRLLFEQYVASVARAERHAHAKPEVLTAEELVTAFEDALADYNRYSRPSISGVYGGPGTEWNLAIAAVASERVRSPGRDAPPHALGVRRGMELPIYTLPDGTVCVLHRHLAHHLGFRSRHDFERTLRMEMVRRAAAWPTDAVIVLRGSEFKEANILAVAAGKPKLTGTCAKLYTMDGCRFINTCLGRTDDEIFKAHGPVMALRAVLASVAAPTPVPPRKAAPTPSLTAAEVDDMLSVGDDAAPPARPGSLAIEFVAFDGDGLDCTRVNGEPYVSLPSLCRPFGKAVHHQIEGLAGWARTTVGGVPDARGRTQATTLLHIESVHLFIARLNTRGMAPAIREKHTRYLAGCAQALARHFGVARYAPVPALAAPVSAPASRGADLAPLVACLNQWVTAGMMSKDYSDRYLADFMRRNEIVDLNEVPPPLPMALRRAAVVADVPSMKHGVVRPCIDARLLLARLEGRFGSSLAMVSLTSVEAVESLARDLGVHEVSLWGEYGTNGAWQYDRDAQIKIFDHVTATLNALLGARRDFSPLTV
jgi:hypothetical protein